MSGERTVHGVRVSDRLRLEALHEAEKLRPVPPRPSAAPSEPSRVDQFLSEFDRRIVRGGER